MRLAVAGLVVRNSFPPNTDTWQLIGAFITVFLVADISLERACKLSHSGSVSLLDLIWERKVQNGVLSFAEMLQIEPTYTKLVFTRTMTEALRRGDGRLVQWILSHFPESRIISQDLVRVAAENGNLQMLQQLEDSNTQVEIEWDPDNICDAANCGLWSFVPYLRRRTNMLSERRTIGYWLVNCAFNQHNLDKIKWSIESELSGDCILFNACSKKDWDTRKDIVRYFLDEKFGDIQRMCIDAVHQAVEMGDLDFVQWILQQGRHIRLYGPGKAMFSAARNGQLHIVKWLYRRYGDNQKRITLFKEYRLRVPKEDSYSSFRDYDLRPTSPMDAAAKYGHLKVLQYLQSTEAEPTKTQQKRRDAGYNRCSTMAMDGAAAKGHLDIVKWLHWNRHEGCTSTAMDRAARNGHLEIVQWLHQNRSEGCTTFAKDNAAARRFHLPSCYNSDSKQCCQKLAPLAFQQNQLAIVQWLHSNRTEGCTTRAMDGAAANGNLEMLQWLHHNTEAGCTNNAMKDAAANGHVHVVQRLHDGRSLACTESIMKKAAADGNLEMTKWLQANYRGWEPEIAMEEAARYGHLCVIRWIPHCSGTRLMPAPTNDMNMWLI
ncbi:hypothetical protein V7S43_012848 [Phytophthora oleae]|uniref:Ankyrin repeat-containing domain n=1 Tax=Phytophthora oleae TaxID=2107226 RepID=A0ABD3F6R9_9STRA